MAASTSPFAAPRQERVVGLWELLQFAYTYSRPQLRTMLLSAVLMTGASALSITIPALAEEIVSYGTATVTGTVGGVFSQFEDSVTDSVAGATDTAANGVTVSDGSVSLTGLGTISERLLRPLLPLFFALPRIGYVASEGENGVDVLWPSPYVEGVLCRCLLMGLSVLCYHATSLLAHLAAYYAGMGAQNSLVEDSVHRILHTHYPERVTIVNAVKMSQVIAASGRALNDTMGELLTNVLAQLLYVAGFFAVMLYLSYHLTLTILIGVLVVQALFFFQGRSLHRQGGKVTAEESSAQAFIANVLQRSETICVFKCSDFVLTRMASRLAEVRRLTNALNFNIHGYAAISSGVTRLILVLALGLSNYYQQKGQLDMRHTILYFACFQSFVNTLVSLSAEVQKTRATLGRLKTLEAMLRWYSEPVDAEDGVGVCRGMVEAPDSESAPVTLSAVSFSYPAVPAFFSEGDGVPGARITDCAAEGVSTPAEAEASSSSTHRLLYRGPAPIRHCNGILDVTFSATVGGITALYGPSGCGKSTCLRMLAGLVRPHRGTVQTHRRAVLLEQQHAIFIGSVAENILLTDLSHLRAADAEGTKEEAASAAALRQRVSTAAEKGGCASFLTNPFDTYIESVDHPPFSGGQLQRISLARVFAQTHGYSLVLLDEPTSGLDREAVQVLLTTLRELRDVHHKTVLISTHDHRVAEVADKVIDMSGSRGEMP